MKWYRISETRTITDTRTKTDYSHPEHTRDILTLSFHLMPIVIDVMRSIMPPKEFERWDSTKSPEFITAGNKDMAKQEGNINFYVNGLSGLALRKAIGAIGYYAKEYGAEVGQPTLETYQTKFDDLKQKGSQIPETMQKTSPMSVRVVRFPVKILES